MDLKPAWRDLRMAVAYSFCAMAALTLPLDHPEGQALLRALREFQKKVGWPLK